MKAIKCPSGEFLDTESETYIFICYGKGFISEQIKKASDSKGLEAKEIPSHIAIGGIDRDNEKFYIAESRFPEGPKLKTFEEFLERNSDSQIEAFNDFNEIDFSIARLLCELRLSYGIKDITTNKLLNWNRDIALLRPDNAGLICSELVALSERTKRTRKEIAKWQNLKHLWPAHLVQPAHYKRLFKSMKFQGVKVQ